VKAQEFFRKLRQDKEQLEREFVEFMSRKLADFQRKWGVNVRWVNVSLVEFRETDKPHGISMVDGVEIQLDI